MNPTASAAVANLPLSHIRVLDLTRVWAGPLATRVLADLGAQVIKVEAPTARGPRQPPPSFLPIFPDNQPGERPWNRDAVTNKHNRNKLGLTLDLTRPQAVALFRALVKISDVVINNYSARVMANFGLHYEALREINPAIIAVSLPGFGMTGPYRDYISLGTVIEATSGFASLTGYPGGPPIVSGVSVPDPAAGLNAVIAVLFALRHRRRTGRGQSIDISQSEVSTTLLGEEVVGYELTGQVPPRLGNRHRSKAPHGCYRCKGQDEWVVIAVGSDTEWERFCEATGRPALTRDPRFADALSRWKNQDALDKLVEEWTREHDHYEAMHLLQRAGVPAGAVLSGQEFVNDPHLNERGFFVSITQPDAGTYPYPGLPLRLSRTPADTWRPAPGLGEHNQRILGELLGLSPPEMAELEKAGVIVKEPPDDPEAYR